MGPSCAPLVTGQRADAERLLAEVQRLRPDRYVPPYHVALAYAGLGDDDAAFCALEHAWLDRDGALGYLGVEPRFERLRGNQRYRALADRLRLGG